MDFKSYDSPIRIIASQIETEIKDECLRVAQKNHVDINENTLILALKADRARYEQAFQRGYECGKIFASPPEPKDIDDYELDNSGHITFEIDEVFEHIKEDHNILDNFAIKLLECLHKTHTGDWEKGDPLFKWTDIHAILNTYWDELMEAAFHDYIEKYKTYNR